MGDNSTGSQTRFSQKICGILVPGPFDPDKVVSAMRYNPRPDDIILVTFPKCGTTWTRQILMLLLKKGRAITSHQQMTVESPFLELSGTEVVEAMHRPGAIMTHLPHNLAPWSDEAKYIYVARNPKDACVSYFHSLEKLGIKENFDGFFEKFIAGDTFFGDYFDHLIGWYHQRNKPNVFFITYEEMKQNPRAAILQIASFIDEEMYAKPLREDPNKMEHVLRYSSFEYMKKSFSGIDSEEKEERKNEISHEMKNLVECIVDKAERNIPIGNMSHFIRKGMVGDWKNHLSNDQNKRLNEKLILKTKGTDLYDVWRNYI